MRTENRFQSVHILPKIGSNRFAYLLKVGTEPRFRFGSNHVYLEILFPFAIPSTAMVSWRSSPAVVELTQMVALENMRSRFNSAAGLQSQGYSDVCELPLARPAAVPSHP